MVMESQARARTRRLAPRGPARPALPFILVTLLSATVAEAASLPLPVVFCQTPVKSPPERLSTPGANPLLTDLGEGGRIAVLEPDGSSRVLSEGFASACDPDVSFDGHRLLFAGKRRPQDSWSIWEMNVDGSDARQITSETLDSRNPIYLSTFYTITSPEPWYTLLFVRDDGTLAEADGGTSTSLYTVRLDGSERLRITFDPDPDLDPFLLADGYVIYAGRRRLGIEDRGSASAILGVNVDGTDHMLYGPIEGPPAIRMPVATVGGLVVFVESDARTPLGAGRLAAVRLQRPLHSYRPLTGDDEWLYHSPAPLEDGTILVSRRAADGSGSFGLARFDPDKGTGTAVFDAPDYDDIRAKVLAPRPEPDGRSSSVRPQYQTGKLYGLDVYDADERLRPHLTPGLVSRLRVIEGVPAAPRREPLQSSHELHASAATPLPPAIGPQAVSRRLLGEVPVEADGSFHFDLPADVPVELQALDGDGLALATCGWIWVKQREFRGCIGCHEDPELTPENRQVEAVLRPAHQLTLPPERRRTVVFRTDVWPILRARCLDAGCHAGGQVRLQLASPRGDAGESEAARAYGALLAATEPTGAHLPAYVDPGRARTSPLVWALLGRDTSRPWDAPRPRRDEPPADHSQLLGPIERRLIVEWIDLGAQWDAPAEASERNADGGTQP